MKKRFIKRGEKRQLHRGDMNLKHARDCANAEERERRLVACIPCVPYVVHYIESPLGSPTLIDVESEQIMVDTFNSLMFCSEVIVLLRHGPDDALPAKDPK